MRNRNRRLLMTGRSGELPAPQTPRKAPGATHRAVRQPRGAALAGPALPALADQFRAQPRRRGADVPSGCAMSSPTNGWKQIEEKHDAWNSVPLEKLPIAEARKFVDQWGGTTKLLRIGTRRQFCDWSYPLAEQRAGDDRDPAAGLPVHEAVGAPAAAQGQGRDGRARLRPGRRYHRNGHCLRPARRPGAVRDQQPCGHRDLQP